MPARKRVTASKPTRPQAAPAKPAAPIEASVAFARIEKEVEALGPDDLEPINVDIPRAVAVAIGAAPHLHNLRALVVEQLPAFPIRLLDEIGTYALGAWFAHLLALPATSEKQLAVLLEEGTSLRDDLLIAAEALAHKGHFDRKAVEAIRAGQGNIDKANDLVALAALFAREWDKVKNKTTVEWADVQRASELGPEILVALGARDQPGVKAPSPADPAQRRARAFTLFVRAYEECRRAVGYLRWHEDDADTIAPSLYATRTRRGPAEAAGDEVAAPVNGSIPAPADAPQ